MIRQATVPSPARLLELIDGMAGRRVVMLVDLVADRFIAGTPKRISREAPVLILQYEGETLAPGGGANAVANVAALGGRPYPLGFLGGDAVGRRLLDAFSDQGIVTDGILPIREWATPTKTRILAGARHALKQQVVRYDRGEPLEPDPESEEELLRRLRSWSLEVDAAVVSDYGYGGAHPELARALEPHLGGRCSWVVDSRHRLAEYGGLEGATPNAEEAERLLGRGLSDRDAEVEAAGLELLERLGARYVLVTRGNAGMSLFTRRLVAHLPVHGGDQVADVTGAGDTVIATFSLARAAGASELEAACLADYAGGIVVMKMGTATCSADELRGAVERDSQLLGRLTLQDR